MYSKVENFVNVPILNVYCEIKKNKKKSTIILWYNLVNIFLDTDVIFLYVSDLRVTWVMDLLYCRPTTVTSTTIMMSQVSSSTNSL